MGQAKDGLGVTMGVGGVNVAFHDVVVHQTIDDVGALAVCGADHQRMPQEMSFIDEGVGAHALSLPEILERAAGVQALAPHLEFLSVARSMKDIGFAAVKIGQFHFIHGADNGVIGGTNIIEREAPVDGVFQLALGDARGNPRHLAHADTTSKAHDPG